MSGALHAMPQPAATLAELRDRVAEYCGVYFDDTRSSALETAALQRAAALGRPIEQYVAALGASADQGELQRLVELLLNHETQFYRNRAQMAALERVILPELHRRLPPGAPLRLWSAGCASGEEPYSLAIAAYEALGDPLPRPVEIWGTDLSGGAIERARAGVYRGRAVMNLAPHLRARYFDAQGDALVVGDRLRQVVRFEQGNLLAPFPAHAAGVHVIFCQNVTIYFQLKSCQALIERFYRAMADGGLLFLGFSETLWTIFDRFRWREEGGAYIYQKDGSAGVPQAAVPAPALGRSPVAPGRRQAGSTAKRSLAGAEAVTRARALLDAGNSDAALALVAATPLLGASAPQLLAVAARAHADRGDLDLAAAEARRALELNPRTMDAHLLIGVIHARQGRPEEAVLQLERARYIDDGSPVITFHLAECYRQLGQHQAALREYRNTLRTLAALPPNRLIDGVAPGWLSDTCRHYEALLSSWQS